MPQPPQFCVSTRLVQVVPQHTPCAHCRPVMMAVQIPDRQVRPSLWQVDPLGQPVPGGVQPPLPTQTPLTQSRPLAQRVPGVPQLRESLRTSMQLSPRQRPRPPSPITQPAPFNATLQVETAQRLPIQIAPDAQGPPPVEPLPLPPDVGDPEVALPAVAVPPVPEMEAVCAAPVAEPAALPVELPLELEVELEPEPPLQPARMHDRAIVIADSARGIVTPGHE